MVAKKSDPPNYTLGQAQRDIANLRGQISRLGTTPTIWTPALTGIGTATFNVLTGYYYRLGKLIFMNAYLTINAAGSGASTLTITSPTNPDRSDRQVIHGQREGATGTQGVYNMIAFTGGSGNVWDRIREQAGNNITGADLIAGSIIVFNGWYREA